MTIINKEEMARIIKELVTNYGFAIREDVNFDWIPYVEDEDVNFLFLDKFDFEGYRKTGVALDHIVLNVSIKRMGGQPTVAELKKTASKIHDAALVMEVFNSRKYAVREEE